MIKLTETLEGDDVQKFHDALPQIGESLKGLTDGTITIKYVVAEDPTQGTIDGVPFISECLLRIFVDVNRVYPEMINDIYILVGRKIQEMGFGEFPFKLSIRSLYLINGPLIIDLLEESFDRNYTNHLRYDNPTIQYILSGQYSLVLPQDVLPKFFEQMDEWIKILIKRATVYYTVYKKGKIDGHEYELIDDPDIRVVVRGRKDVKSERDLIPFIDSKFKTIDGIERGSSDFPYNLQDNLIDKLEKKFTEKHNVRIFIDDTRRV